MNYSYFSSNISEVVLQKMTTNAPLTNILFKIFTNAAFFYLFPFIPLGIVFNIIILLVFGRSRLGTTETTRIYYLVMAWGELGTVLFKDLWFFYLGIGVTEVFHTNLIGALNVHVVSNQFLCSFLWFIWYAHETAANNAFVVFEFERVFALYMPLKSRFSTWFTQRKAIAVMLVDLVLSTLVSATIFGFARFQTVSPMPYGTFCFFASNLGVWSIVPVLVFLTNYILPAFLSIVSSVLISLKLLQRSRTKGALNASTLQICVTLLILSLMRVTFYVPLAIFRLAYLILPSIVEFSHDTSFQILAAGFICYIFVIPVCRKLNKEL